MCTSFSLSFLHTGVAKINQTKTTYINVSQKQPSGAQFGPQRDVSANIGGSQFLPNVELNLAMSQFPALAYRQTCTRHTPFLKSLTDSPHPIYFAGLHSA
mmetsp:Transcript_3763/g.8526  ORF Transcript_3763/g.8526 Transcript_3763/m.8526 type:complete len:100 (+) Transcript_3763:3-302(+)